MAWDHIRYVLGYLTLFSFACNDILYCNSPDLMSSNIPLSSGIYPSSYNGLSKIEYWAVFLSLIETLFGD